MVSEGGMELKPAVSEFGPYYKKSDAATVVINTYTADQWAAMEEAGAVFLPAAGERNGTRVRSVGYWGEYWTSTCDYEIATCVLFWNYPDFEDRVGPYVDGAYCCDGSSVRLVQDVEP